MTAPATAGPLLSFVTAFLSLRPPWMAPSSAERSGVSVGAEAIAEGARGAEGAAGGAGGGAGAEGAGEAALLRDGVEVCAEGGRAGPRPSPRKRLAARLA